MARMAGRVARVTGALGCAAALLALAACSDGDHRGDGGAARSATPTGGPGATAAPVWGFASVTATGSSGSAPTAIPAAQSAGSWHTAGGSSSAAAQVTVVRRQPGGYRVTFPGIAVAAGRGAAIVTALDPAAAVVETTAPVVSCHVVGWGAAGRDEQVDLTCRDAAGAPVDSAFSALFTQVPDTASLTSTPPASPGTLSPVTASPVTASPSPSSGGAYAYLRSDAASAATSRPTNAYSVSGPGTIEVHRVGAGHYTIDLTGPAFAKNGNNLQVNAIGDGPVGCNALGRVVKKDRQSVFVGCARGSVWTDSPFVLLYTSGHALIPTGAASFGHAFTGVLRPGGPIQQVPPGPPVNAWAWYSANSTGATNQISRVGVGRYRVIFPGVSRTPHALQVTPYGEPTARCAANELPVAAGAPTAVTVAVRCVDAAGRPADSYASVAYVSAPGPTTP
ncbi:hypothetical protein FF36_01623 [Frankia torreyi]|uniref:Uncharacterized protein n=1 Tax=Frankia torreyi TaxID=1856 RepID=A0A0D8BIH9_9ACTN|nr:MULTISPECIES: hypothetical protein [Frankia]KJE23936.1 hypothetical protein FF36_01623 [Frankia torreyi]